MFGLGTLFYVILLTVNGIAVLSEDRFLNRIGWSSAKTPANGYNAQFQQFQADSAEGSVKTKLINLISAVRTLLRVPLIGINIIVIAYELVLG